MHQQYRARRHKVHKRGKRKRKDISPRLRAQHQQTPKKIEFNVFYKKTNTNITIKKRSYHCESIKYGVIKGYADRARALCDEEHIAAVMKNIREVSEDHNGHQKEEIDSMKETELDGEVQPQKRHLVTKNTL